MGVTTAHRGAGLLAGTVFVLVLAACGRTPLDPRDDGGVLDDGEPPPECTLDAECDDGLFCTGVERCSGGRCIAGTTVVCDDAVPCTDDRCVEASRACESVPDSGRCGPGELCDPRAGCLRRPCGGDPECQDGFVCNGSERCVGGFCAGGTAPDCSDGVACTVDECSEAVGGCRPRPDDGLCADGVFCNGAERCVPASGGCVSPPFDCEDGDDCTVDRCNEARRACEHTPVDDPACMPIGCPDLDIGSRVGPAVNTGTTVGAGNDQRGSCGGARAAERTLRWTAPRDGTWRFDTSGSSYDTLLYILARCGGAELPGMCNDDSFGSLQSSLELFVRGGGSVVLVVDGFGNQEGAYQLNIQPTGMMCEPVEARCFDASDDDCDGLVDCADPDCNFEPSCCVPSPERCASGADEDCDGLVDCSDGDCRLSLSCRPDGGMDGGTDGGVGEGGMCTDREIGVAACTDGLDGDCDGSRDCGDTDCSPFGPDWECCNGMDDDGDGQVDIFTCRCSTDADCATVGTLEQVCWSEVYSVCAPRCNFYGGTSFCRMIDPSLTCDSTTGQCVPT